MKPTYRETMKSFREQYFRGLSNISPVDGREIAFTQSLTHYFSEGALHRYRAIVEIALLRALAAASFPGMPALESRHEDILRSIEESIDPFCIAEYDHFGRGNRKPLEHDVKSVEVYLRECFEKTELQPFIEYLHFPATSEDINNLAWNMMLRDGINHVWLPQLLAVCDQIAEYAEQYATVPVLGVTHGMSASPTTFGKRFAYFLARMTEVLEHLVSLQLSGKFAGPTGNHNAITAVVPEFDFPGFAKRFVEQFGFVYEPCEHQRNSHVSIVRLLSEMNLVNSIAADLCAHVRHSVMMGLLVQESVPENEGNVGSSVMPHKINPWFFEVAEGYLEQAIALSSAAGPHLMQSVFERDLTDHPWERAYGEMIGKSVVGFSYIAKGLRTIRVNRTKARADLRGAHEVLTEAVQIAGRMCNVPDIYMKIKEVSRNKSLDYYGLQHVIQTYIPDGEMKQRLLSLSPEEYIGKASELAHAAVIRYLHVRVPLEHGILHPMAGIEAVLFDFDNTLHFGDKDELYARLESISERMNFGFSREEIHAFGNRSDYKVMRKLMVDAFNAKRNGRTVTEDEFQLVNNEISGTLDHHLTVAPYAIDLLKFLGKMGYKTALVTTRGSNSLPRLLKKHGLDGWFDVVVNRDDIGSNGKPKPHPQPIALALQKLGVPGSRAVYVGDNQVDDIIAGRALGMTTILLNSGELDGYGAIPAYHCESMREVAALFRWVK